MSKKIVLKKAIGVGAALTLSVVTGIAVNDAVATTLSTETDLAGISVTLDDYYTANYASTGSAVEESTSEVEETTESSEEVVSGEVTETAEATAEVEETATAETDDLDVDISKTIENATETAEAEETEETEETTESASSSAVDKKDSSDDSKAEEDKEDEEDKKDGPGRFITEERFEDVGISIASEYVNVRKAPSEDAKILGKLYRGCSAKILSYKGDWVQIESGDVKGYINKEFLAIGEDAEELAAQYMKRYVTVKEGVVTLNVRAKKGTNCEILTQIPEGEMYEVKGSATYWVKIDLGDGDTGYVAKQYVDCKVRFKHAISLKEERAKLRAKRAAERAEKKRLAALAAQRAAEEEAAQQAAQAAQQQASTNTGSTSTYTAPTNNTSSSNSSSSSSSKSNKSNKSSNQGSPVSGSTSSSSSNSGSSKSAPVGTSSKGSEIASYAQKFIGNPYVYGGTSLTNGTDCSGFVMSVYAQFGYSLPRTAAAQAGAGRSVSFSNLQPGDLLFYSNGSYIGHVAMYIGGGMVVHASNPTDGIKTSVYNYRTPTCARRIV
ncbi:MAG: C40 family peptidase [Lachnospiraceae bacterium]|nr:C40 family peptidase [Lachnospiraceae bacterium]